MNNLLHLLLIVFNIMTIKYLTIEFLSNLKIECKKLSKSDF